MEFWLYIKSCIIMEFGLYRTVSQWSSGYIERHNMEFGLYRTVSQWSLRYIGLCRNGVLVI